MFDVSSSPSPFLSVNTSGQSGKKLQVLSPLAPAGN